MAEASAQDIIALKNKLIQTSLDMAGETPWADISMHDIAQRAEVDIDTARALCPDKNAIIMGYARQVDLQLSDNFDGETWDGMSEKDRLFDVLMDRFDILNENRAGVISIVNAITMNPTQAVCTLPVTCESMERMMRLANVQNDGWRGAMKVTALSGIYLKSLRDWVGDDTTDMAATMASLDKGLGYLDKINF